MRIRAYEILEARIGLLEPYVLSFATVKEICSIVVRLGLEDGNTGFSEAVPLPGYSEETRNSIIRDLRRTLPEIMNMETEELTAFLKEKLPRSPFAVSAVVTAKEVSTGEVALPNHLEVPLLAPVSAARNPRPVLKKALAFLDQGYGTIKLKVGRDLDADVKTIRFLLDELPDNVKIRIDANQGYTLEDARVVMQALEHPKNHIVELFEQPFGTREKDWETFRQLAEETDHVPLMLDESIIQDEHVERAADVGASLVKLKLFKQPGVAGLLSLAARARELGMKVVLGNGVSTEIGNLLEGVAYVESGLFTGASEGNGFVKLMERVLNPEVKVSAGRMEWSHDPAMPFSESLIRRRYEVLDGLGW